MGRISYPRTFLNARKLIFPFLNEIGKLVETLGLVVYSSDLKSCLENDLHSLKKIAEDAHSQGWPKIPKKDLKNFKTIKPIKISAGTKIYRVIGLDNFKGGYWLKNIPNNELAFRRDFAVRNDWNGNGGYIEVEVKTEILAYEGQAIGQKVVVDKTYVLTGGATQVWMPSGEHFSFDLESMQSSIKSTGW